jgi:hypothetical protein
MVKKSTGKNNKRKQIIDDEVIIYAPANKKQKTNDSKQEAAIKSKRSSLVSNVSSEMTMIDCIDVQDCNKIDSYYKTAKNNRKRKQIFVEDDDLLDSRNNNNNNLLTRKKVNNVIKNISNIIDIKTDFGYSKYILEPVMILSVNQSLTRNKKTKFDLYVMDIHCNTVKFIIIDKKDFYYKEGEIVCLKFMQQSIKKNIYSYGSVTFDLFGLDIQILLTAFDVVKKITLSRIIAMKIHENNNVLLKIQSIFHNYEANKGPFMKLSCVDCVGTQVHLLIWKEWSYGSLERFKEDNILLVFNGAFKFHEQYGYQVSNCIIASGDNELFKINNYTHDYNQLLEMNNEQVGTIIEKEQFINYGSTKNLQYMNDPTIEKLMVMYDCEIMIRNFSLLRLKLLGIMYDEESFPAQFEKEKLFFFIPIILIDEEKKKYQIKIDGKICETLLECTPVEYYNKSDTDKGAIIKKL